MSAGFQAQGDRMADWDEYYDAEGLLCPLPVLRAAKLLRQMAPGTVLRLSATDGASWVDVPHFCAQSGHELIEAEDTGARLVYLIRRGAETPPQ
jgi:tRNA 2-thiouridine synthesizing protein A